MYIRSNMKRIDWEKNTTSDAAQQKKKGIFPHIFRRCKETGDNTILLSKGRIENKRERYHVRAEIDLSG